MEINEVKLGDKVTFSHNKKMVTGKVIYRHQDKDKAALMGHVNVQILGDKPSYPVTVHVSKIKPALKEEFYMEHIKESLTDLLDNIDSGNHIQAEEIFNTLLQQKIDELLDAAKVEVAQNMFNTSECAECDEDVTEAKKMKDGKGAEKDEEEEEDEDELDEALKGKQHKIDANKNGKIDAQDFKMLRGKKGVKEEVEDLDELKKSTLQNYADKVGGAKGGMGGGQLKGLANKAHAQVKSGDTAGAQKTAQKYVKREKGLKNAVNQLHQKRFQKEDVEATQEAYSDPYAAKKAAEMKKAHAATMADAKKEYDSAKKPKFSKNFMKMKKEEVEQVDELKQSTYASAAEKRDKQAKTADDVNLFKSSDALKNKAYALRKHAFKKSLSPATKRNIGMKEDIEQVDEVITKKTPTGEVVSDFVHSKNPKFKGKSKKERIKMALGAKYAMMKGK